MSAHPGSQSLELQSRTPIISRRCALSQLAVLAGGVHAMADTDPDSPPRASDARRSKMGIVMYDCGLRRRWLKQRDPSSDLFEPMTFLRHCHSLGAGGSQCGLGILAPAVCETLRQFADQHGLFIEAIVSPPQSDEDLPRFDAEMRTARDAGAKAARTVIIPGRRYEHFRSYSEFQLAAKLGHAMVKRSIPVVEKYEVPLAIENHKDERIDQRIALLESINSPLIGACVDTGNSFSLLDDVYGAIKQLAPFAFSVHFKDQSLAEYEDGFLLGDTPLGRGSFDLPRIATILRAAKPKLQFCLEVITRDPLKVPCLTPNYWKLVPEPSGLELAKTLQFVRQNSRNSMSVESLTLAEQVQLEDSNIATCLEYAAKVLSI